MDRSSRLLVHEPERVAIVDDEPDCREVIGEAINASGLSCSGFATAESFLATDDLDEFSCVLVDIQLPGMNGLDLLTTLATRTTDVAFIVLSGQATVPDVVRAYEHHASGFFQKPVPLPQLLEMVGRLVLRKSEQRERQIRVDQMLIRLTARERQVMQLLLAGDKTVQIAHKLEISPSTVEKHRLRIFEKTGAGSVVELLHRVPNEVASKVLA
jgi:FixJ family two-component response regulator